MINPPALPAPTVTAICPKCSAHALVHDNDPSYNVTSYKLRPCNAEHAGMAWTDRSMEPKTYTKAMTRPDVAIWEAACEEEWKLFKAIEVFKVVPWPELLQIPKIYRLIFTDIDLSTTRL
jgi:hypothetical protein